MAKKELITILQKHPELKKDLFIRGFLITDQDFQLSDFPFYGNWKKEKYGGYFFMAHESANMYIHEASGKILFLMGHAYDPFSMEYREETILKKMTDTCGTEAWLERVNDLTGIFVLGFIQDGEIHFLTDPSGMQSACCSKTDKGFFLSSHPQLIGDLCGFGMNPFVEELIRYKWYGRVMGPYLPADLTPFAEVKRVVPDILYHCRREIRHERFWPLKNNPPVKDRKEYRKVIRDAAKILRNNMELVSRKWEHPWISLTGGIDSNTTFAAANGIYDRFETFSYISAKKEIQDADAAKKISSHFGLPHHEFRIPDENSELKDYQAIRAVLMHNNGYVADTKDNEIRKRIYLRQHSDCDVEVKSWVSETIRGYWYKHYERQKMPALSPKLFRNLYKIFLGNRLLAHKVDLLFSDYIRDFEYDRIPASYPPADMHFSEMTWGSWGGLNISEMKYCYDITIIYNNRRFLNLMFRVPLKMRISDRHHLDLKKYLNEEIYKMNIRIVNLHETRFRAKALNAVFTTNMLLPF